MSFPKIGLEWFKQESLRYPTKRADCCGFTLEIVQLDEGRGVRGAVLAGRDLLSDRPYGSFKEAESKLVLWALTYCLSTARRNLELAQAIHDKTTGAEKNDEHNGVPDEDDMRVSAWDDDDI